MTLHKRLRISGLQCVQSEMMRFGDVESAVGVKLPFFVFLLRYGDGCHGI